MSYEHSVPFYLDVSQTHTFPLLKKKLCYGNVYYKLAYMTKHFSLFLIGNPEEWFDNIEHEDNIQNPPGPDELRVEIRDAY